MKNKFITYAFFIAMYPFLGAFSVYSQTSHWHYVDKSSTDALTIAAINNALNSNRNVSLLPGKTYTINSSIKIPDSTVLQVPAGTTVLYKYTVGIGKPYAVIIQNFASLVGDGKIKNADLAWNWSNKKTGVMFDMDTNIMNAKIDFGIIEGFEVGIDIGGAKLRYSNNIKVRFMYDNVIGLYIHPKDTIYSSNPTMVVEGCVNNNYFHFDRMEEHRTSSNPTAKTLWDNYSVGILMEKHSNPNTNTFSGHLDGYNIGIQLAGCFNRIVGMAIRECKTARIKMIETPIMVPETIYIHDKPKIIYVPTSPKYDIRKNYIFGIYGEIYDLDQYHSTQRAILNETGRPLSDLVSIFGWDKYTYLNVLTVKDQLVTSDERLKENIRNIDDGRSKILKIQGKKYNFKANEPDLNGIKKSDYGFIAQEVKEIIPELVSLNPLDSMYSINYIGFVPILTEAINEQQNLIESNKTEIEKIQKLNSELIELLARKNLLDSTNYNRLTEKPILYKLNPIKYVNDAKIGIYLPNNIDESMVQITDFNGKLIKQIAISERGKIEILILAKTFSPGMYWLTLIADNELIDTKKLIVTK